MNSKQELTCREFLEKIMKLSGTGALIDDTVHGRYKLRLHFEGEPDQEFISPYLFSLPVTEAVAFENSVEAEAFRKMPRLSRYRY